MIMTDAVEEVSLEEAKRIVLGKLGGTRAKVYLFGSRAQGNPRAASDIDIGILDDAPIADILLSDIRETLFESTIPYRVDVVDLGQVDAEFRRRVLTEGIPWKDKQRLATARNVGGETMIRNDQELAVMRERVTKIERLLETLRETARQEEWPALSSGYRLEIERMQGEILDYLVQGAPRHPEGATA